MIKGNQIRESLAKTFCHRCGTGLSDASLTTVSEMPFALVVHIVCPKCEAAGLVTVTSNGSGLMPIVSDLTGEEINKFMGESRVTTDDLLDLHQLLEKESIWKLLQKQEKNLVKKQKHSGKIEKSLQ